MDNWVAPQPPYNRNFSREIHLIKISFDSEICFMNVACTCNLGQVNILHV